MLWAVDRRVDVSGAELRGESGVNICVEAGAFVASDTSSSAPACNLTDKFETCMINYCWTVA